MKDDRRKRREEARRKADFESEIRLFGEHLGAMLAAPPDVPWAPDADWDTAIDVGEVARFLRAMLLESQFARLWLHQRVGGGTWTRVIDGLPVGSSRTSGHPGSAFLQAGQGQSGDGGSVAISGGAGGATGIGGDIAITAGRGGPTHDFLFVAGWDPVRTTELTAGCPSHSWATSMRTRLVTINASVVRSAERGDLRALRRRTGSESHVLQAAFLSDLDAEEPDAPVVVGVAGMRLSDRDKAPLALKASIWDHVLSRRRPWTAGPLAVAGSGWSALVDVSRAVVTEWVSRQEV